MAKIKFNFPIGDYNPQALQEGYSERELRAEYTRLRSAAQKRLRAFETAEGGYFAGTQEYKRNVNHYKRLRDIPKGSPQAMMELSHMLSDIARFLTAKRGSVTGQREIRAANIDLFVNDWGLTWINKSNYFEFIHFLEFAKDFQGKNYDIMEIRNMATQAHMEGLPLSEIEKNFAYYQEKWADKTGDPPPRP